MHVEEAQDDDVFVVFSDDLFGRSTEYVEI
jgi:hypothetical protein